MRGSEVVQTDVNTSQSSAVKGKKDIGQQLEVGEASVERETLFVRRLGANTRQIYRNE